MEIVEAEFIPQFLEKMLDGVAYCQMVFEDGNPIDFRYLYTNPAFHAQTRLGSVAGKLVSEIIPGIRRSDPVLFERYGRVSSTGKSDSFEIYVEGLGDWFLVHAFCPKPGHFVATFNVITKSKEAEFRIDHLAKHDLLTDLPNRALFYDRLSNAIARARRNSKAFYLFLLDLDDFKPINDLYGHKAGDIVLKNVAGRLISCVRTVDTVGRLGGDEFGIILDWVRGPTDAKVFAEKFIARLSSPVTVGNADEAHIGVSIGIASYPESGEEIDTLLRCADSSMYEAKKQGKGSYAFYRRQASDPTGAHWVNVDGALLLDDRHIDNDHKAIAEYLNKINVSVRRDESVELLRKLYDEMIDFVVRHFSTEERLMEECQYPDLIAHKSDHAQLIKDAERLRTRLLQGGEMFVLQALKDWFVIHIVSFDKPLADFRRRVE